MTARTWTWNVLPGAVVACRWQDDDGIWRHRLLVADELGLAEGPVQIHLGNPLSAEEAARLTF